MTKYLLNQRQKSLLSIIFVVLLLLSIGIGGKLLDSDAIRTHLDSRYLLPSWDHLFGTDWLGRDMFTRTIKGLALSIQVGIIGALASSIIAVIMGFIAATLGKTADRIVSWIIDLFLSVPHLVTLILISFVFGGGMKGIIIGIACTHWTSLARVIRAELLQIRNADYVLISRQLGKSNWWIASRHMLPHIVPQFIVGILLLFPHAILHEAAITFIGLGLSPHQPAVGIILSESMKYLSTGMWWLAFFPGLCLLVVVRAFDILGGNLKLLIDPRGARD